MIWEVFTIEFVFQGQEYWGAVNSNDPDNLKKRLGSLPYGTR
jgi:hypothetical protein